ncbi:hypothetical protein [Archangium violaceum]|uniref:Uncharacterized protein n=1 Tax=Archangium violaceum Cb vi76 TaxID=1406225 RepID=A0A084SSR7_9BACT|nr:hypothetical protein [Archangium violaceum]KFA91502.1 hypothetical protein Q664_22120 [Archangium violaceum Cb vi76]
MSDVTTQAQDLFGTLDEYLINLADGLAQAQQELGQLSAAGAPGRQFTYYVPKLEFELRMDLKVETETRTSGTGVSAKVLKMKPVRVVDTAQTQTSAGIVSVIRGSFVAVPANEGLPATLLEAVMEKDTAGRPVVVARVRNAAGEPVVGLEVEFNLDRAGTQRLSGRAPLAATDVSLAVVGTDAAGEARTNLRLADGELAKTLVVTVDAGPRMAVVAYEAAS